MSTSDLGAISSVYGSLGALVSSITLISAFAVVYLQNNTLKAMRKESFNSMFISLLELNRKIIGELDENNSCMYFSQLSDDFTKAFGEISEKYKIYSIDQITNEMKIDIKKELKIKLREATKVKKQEGLIEGFYSKFKNYVSYSNVVKEKGPEDSTKGFYSKFKSFRPLLKIIKDNKDISSDEKEMYFELIRSTISYGEKKALLWLAITSSNDEYKECLKGTNLLDLKIKSKNSDTEKDKEKAKNIIKISKVFGIDSTCFKSNEDFLEK